MRAFELPQVVVIMDNEFGELQAFEHEPADPLQKDDPKVTIHYEDGSFACMPGEEWAASIRRQALEAHKRGESSITIK